MEEFIKIRIAKADKERLKEIANERGITLSDLILSALKVKRKKVRKPVSSEIKNLVHQAA
jgi:antitoxin component of RelBE/YafQ-DinJ toxin-antitoxin module